MFKYSIKDIATITQATATIVADNVIDYLLVDSRKIVFPTNSLFFALTSNRRDGHQFIKEVYDRGVTNFVANIGFDNTPFPKANFLFVNDTTVALQQLAAHHRQQFNTPVIGITGSNGKTIVKEWLYQLLLPEYNIVRSPRSYNSQIGVPLSIWQMNAQHTLGIFEAGISTTAEMEKLEQMIQPTIGIFTTLGNAHNEGFSSMAIKVAEKFKLFANATEVVYPANEEQLTPFVKDTVATTHFSWGNQPSSSLQIISTKVDNGYTLLNAFYQHQLISITIPFVDDASINNACTCWATMLLLQYNNEVIAARMKMLQPVEMRLQLKKAINNCSVINDTYSNDISSLSIALDYLKQQSGNQPTTVILSDILQSGLKEEDLYKQVAQELQHRNISRFIGIGEQIGHYQSLFKEAIAKTVFFTTTESFLQQNTHSFKDEFILLKGARIFAFERISHWLEQKVHQTVMEINLTAMVHNLKQYQQQLQPSTKLMAMVKAFSYGSGSAEIARLLQFHKVDYLAVAYADEGIDLRKAGISLPIMVMNADEAGFDALLEYNLEPEIYSFNIYHSFNSYLQQQGINHFPVHIKLNTGMNRLGFDAHEVAEFALLLQQHSNMVVKSVFSHLTSSEAAEHDGFTQQQAALFIEGCNLLEEKIGYPFIKHIANTAGIFRHPNLQYDMVRLGIGLYGVDSANGKEIYLETVATLKSTIAQIRTVKANDTIGYNRKGQVTVDTKIATIRIGYADGFSRKLSNGIGSIYINNNLAKVVGSVCMDMVMVDITNIPNVQEGDEVEIFGKHLSIQQVAEWCGTISYEIMTSISQRVKRVYIEE